MQVNLWGTRGSIARSSPSIVKYGGNTSCVEVETETTRIVLDLGSGAYDLGQKLVKMGCLTGQHVLLSHTHWDHIQGFPFFAPLFIKGSSWTVHAPGGFSSTIKEKLASQMSHEFFPLGITELAATINYQDLKEGELQLGDIKVYTQYINHTVLTLGYRLECLDGNGPSMAYITDHEAWDHRLATEGYTRNVSAADDRHADFFDGVDLLIHDTQYLSKEYKAKEGWGHTTVEYVVDMAMDAGVKKLALFHHDPNRTDAQVDEILAFARERVNKAGGTLEVIAAADNMSVKLDKSSSGSNLSPSHYGHEKKSALTSNNSNNIQDVLVKVPDISVFEGLESDGIRVKHTLNQGESFLEEARRMKPSLLLLRYSDGNGRVLKDCSRLRKEGGEWGKEVPLIVTVENQKILEEVKQKGEEYGVTDWVVEPYTQAYIRTRIRMGILRSPCKWIRPRLPANEKARLEALNSLNILDSDPEERFDRITRLCIAAFGVPSAVISLVDENRQWSKSKAQSCPFPCTGGEVRWTPRDVSFCGHTILQNDILVIPDLKQDGRFADNPLVADPNGVKCRFYAGCPISVPNVAGKSFSSGGTEYNIGTLCLIDQKPRVFGEDQKKMLLDFSQIVKRELLSITCLNGSELSHQLAAKTKKNGVTI